MIHIVQDWNAQKHAAHLEQMFALRARVFGHRLGWDVKCVNERERDTLDDASPVYVMATDETDTVVGSCRLLPTTGPTLLDACFSDTLPDAAGLVDPTIWECTRFCIAPISGDSRLDLLGEVTQSVIGAVIDVARSARVETIIANLDAITLRMCRRAGYDADLLGMTLRYGPAVYLVAFAVAHAAEVNRRRNDFVAPARQRAAEATGLLEV